MTPSPNSWQKLLSALRAARRLQNDAEGAPQIPPGFATRIAARAAAERREHFLALWRRWSLRFAIGSTCLFFVAALYAVATQDTGQILPIPTL